MDKDQFVKAYGQVVSKAWSDPGYLSELQSNPSATLAQAGLEVPSSATVTIDVVKPTGQGNVDQQWGAWEGGLTSNAITIWIPEKPELLGLDADVDGTVATTCTPCTTCT